GEGGGPAGGCGGRGCGWRGVVRRGGGRGDGGGGEVGPPGGAGGPGGGGGGGPSPAVPHADLHPHSPPAPADRDGGRHDVPLHRHFACRGARDCPRGCGR